VRHTALVLRVAAILAMAVTIALAVAPSPAQAQQVQATLLPARPLVPLPSLRDDSAVSLLEQQRDTTAARRIPLLDRLSVEQQIGLAGIVVASTTLIVANRLRAGEPVRSGFAIDQRYFVAVGAILGATVTAIWIERRKRDHRDAH
jgi:hypothetical protein